MYARFVPYGIGIDEDSFKYVANLPSRWNVNKGNTIKGMLTSAPHAFPPPLVGRTKRSKKGVLPGDNPEDRRDREDLQLQTELRPEDADEVAALLHTNFHAGVRELISACVETSQRPFPWAPSETEGGPEDVRVWQLRTADGELCSAVAWRPLLLSSQRGIEVLFLATEPRMRGGGCAEDLVLRLEDFARLAGWDFLCVAVVPTAPGFWGKLGLRLCARAAAVRGDVPPCAEAAWLQLEDADLARQIARFCAEAPLRDELVKAMVSFSDTPLFVKSGLRGPRSSAQP